MSVVSYSCRLFLFIAIMCFFVGICQNLYFLHPHALRFAGRIPMSWHIVVLTIKICYRDIIKLHSWIIKERDVVGICRNPCAGFLALFFLVGHTADYYPSSEMQPHVCDVSAQGSLLETQCPRLLLEPGHTGTLPSTY